MLHSLDVFEVVYLLQRSPVGDVDAAFAEAAAAHGLTFIGPSAAVLERFESKAGVRALLAKHGLPTIPGSDGIVADVEAARRAAAAIGYPVMGDTLYGRRSDHIGRQALHAARLGFRLPSTGEWREFTAPLPDDMQHAIEALRARHATRDGANEDEGTAT